MARAKWIVIGVGVFLVAGGTGVALSRRGAAVTDSATLGRERLETARRAVEVGSFLEAVRAARAVPRTGSLAAEARLIEGVGMRKLNRWQAAEDLWKEAMRIDPQVPQAVWQLLGCYFMEQRFREAEELALRVYPIEPDPRDRTLLLLELVREDNERLSPEATVVELEPVTVVEPENFHALRVVGQCFVQLRRFAEGAALIEHAHKLNSNDTENWFTLVWYLYETGDLSRLGEVFEQLPEAAANQARFQRYRGMWAEAVDNSADAERAYRAAIELDSADRKAHYQLARLLRARGAESEATRHEAESRRLDDAREALAGVYQKAVQMNNDPSSDLCREFSRLCRELGRTRQAELWDQEASRRPSSRR